MRVGDLEVQDAVDLSCVLSLVMQTWLGTSSGTSFSECW